MFSRIPPRSSVNTCHKARNVKAGGDTETKPTTKPPPVRTVPAEPQPSQKPVTKPCNDPDKSGCEF